MTLFNNESPTFAVLVFALLMFAILKYGKTGGLFGQQKLALFGNTRRSIFHVAGGDESNMFESPSVPESRLF